MQVKTFITTMGIGVAAGAAAILFMPKNSQAYKKVDQAAQTIKEEATRIVDRMQ